jgi:hypothetical protein
MHHITCIARDSTLIKKNTLNLILILIFFNTQGYNKKQNKKLTLR